MNKTLLSQFSNPLNVFQEKPTSVRGDTNEPIKKRDEPSALALLKKEVESLTKELDSQNAELDAMKKALDAVKKDSTEKTVIMDALEGKFIVFTSEFIERDERQRAEIAALRALVEEGMADNKRKRDVDEIGLDALTRTCPECNVSKSVNSFDHRGKNDKSTGRSVCYSCRSKKYRDTKKAKNVQ